MKVLIVDDSTIAYGNISILIERLGMEVVGNARTEKEIEKIIRHQKPELVLIDTRGSYLQGTETIRKIKQLNPFTNVIAVSVFESQQQVKQIFSSGISDIITKPVEAERLVKSLQNLGILFDEEPEANLSAESVIEEKESHVETSDEQPEELQQQAV